MATYNKNLLLKVPWADTKVKATKTFDIETTGFNPRVDTIFAFCIGHWNGHVDVYRMDNSSKMENIRNWMILKRFIEDTSIRKVAHNYKFEWSFLKRSKMPVKIHIPEESVWDDTMLMSQMLRNLVPAALDYLSWELFGFPRTLDEQVKKLGNQLGNYSLINKELFTEYQVADGFRPMVLYRVFKKRFDNDPALFADYTNELELVRTTEKFENYGMKLDPDACNDLIDWLEDEFEAVIDESTKFFGETINLNSSIKLSNLLYDRLNYPVIKLTKKKNPSLDKDVLLELKERFPNDKVFDFIFRWRSYSSGRTNIKKYLQLADDNLIIHPNIKTNHAKTGREASENPNLQNVAKEAALKNPYPVNARKCFVARDGRILYFVDYSGIEMRLIIEATQEPLMLKMLREGDDPHSYAAELFFGEWFTNQDKCLHEFMPTNKPLFKAFKQACKKESGNIHNIRKEFFKKCKKILRGAAKNGQFALAYGAGVKKIAQTIQVPVEVLKVGFENYRNKFPNIASYSDLMMDSIRENGFVETPFGRKLYVSYDKGHAAGNTRIQGTAAQVIKRAQVRVDKYLDLYWGTNLRLLLPVHDELVLSASKRIEKHEEKYVSEISKIMCWNPEIKIDLDVEWKKSYTSWTEAEEFTL